MSDADELGLPCHAFDRQDDGADLAFYAPARLVTHIDEGPVAALSDFYRSIIPAGGRVLDLMSSWVSHLPDDPGGAVVASFSNRCFPTKAVAIWRALGTDGHGALVRLYLEKAGFSKVTAHVLADGRAGDPLVGVTGRA